MMNQLSAPLSLLFAEGGGGTAFFIIQLVALFAIFYFLLIRPQQKRQRVAKEEREKLLNALKPGDKIVMASGIFGTVVSVRDERVQVKIAPSVAVEVQRTAITGLQSAEAKEAEAAK